MKRAITLLLICLLAFGMCTAALADDCEHNYTVSKAATCTATGLSICGNCGDVLVIPKTNHTYAVSKPATCTATGLSMCSGCGDVLVVPVTNHNYAVSKPATCTATGLSMCSGCGAVLVIPVTNHNYAVSRAATCTATGLSICGACGDVKTDPMTNHSYVVGRAATCSQTGLEICSACGDDHVIPMLAHHYTTTKRPTCNATGMQVCSVCGVTSRTQATGQHTSVADAAVAPTCTSAGLTEGSHCSACKATIVEQTAVAMLAHNYEKQTVEPTADAAGYTSYKCTLCGGGYTVALVAPLEAKDGFAPAANGLGGIVMAPGGAEKAYASASVSAGESKILVVTVDPEADASFTSSELHLSEELLKQLKADGVTEIHFVVGDAKAVIPLRLFETEDINLVKDAQKSGGFVVSVSVADAADAKAVSKEYGVAIGIAGEPVLDVTEIMGGAMFLIASDEASATLAAKSGQTPAAAYEDGFWSIGVAGMDAYTLVAAG